MLEQPDMSMKNYTNHVGGGQCTRPISQRGSGSLVVTSEGDRNDAECYIGGKVGGQEEQLKSRWECADVDS